MTTTAHPRIAAATLGALALAGTIAGCASATGTTSGGTTTTGGDTTANSAAPSTASTGSATTSGTYKDGEYKATANYQSPNGTETITVDLTVAKDAVTAVTVTGKPSGPDATNYQGQFESNISSLVVGKSLDDITVSKVAGSSLTSSGFNSAVDDIKSQAAA